ncbi:hypothetical protein D3C84_1165360 [compost metagenome]
MLVPKEKALALAQFVATSQRLRHTERVANRDDEIDLKLESIEGRLPDGHQSRHARILDADQALAHR